jgi:hypothetical protein
VVCLVLLDQWDPVGFLDQWARKEKLEKMEKMVMLDHKALLVKMELMA